jgi:hypothetical protein
MRLVSRFGPPALAWALSLGLAGTAAASTVTPGDPDPAGISYEWAVSIGGADDATLVRHVGARSWNEPANPPGLKGWTHTSDWAAITLTEPALLTIEITRTADVPNGAGVAGDGLVPAFTIFANHEIEGEEDHVYNNQGNSDWADEIDYLAHEANEGVLASVTRVFALSPGAYSLAIGSNPPADLVISGRHGYTVSLRTAAVPEPGTALLIGAGVVGLVVRRRTR